MKEGREEGKEGRRHGGGKEEGEEARKKEGKEGMRKGGGNDGGEPGMMEEEPGGAPYDALDDAIGSTVRAGKAPRKPHASHTSRQVTEISTA